MQLPLQITFHGLAHSDAVEQYVRQRVAKLDAIAPRLMACRVTVEMPHRHSKHGGHYRVHIDITMPRGEIVVTRAPDADRAYEDAYAAIDACFAEARRKLHEFTRRKRGNVKAHGGAQRPQQG
jgi:ribosome-associated translation inhibitor RaiA